MYISLLLLEIVLKMLAQLLLLRLLKREFTTKQLSIYNVFYCSVTVGASDRYDQFAWFSNWGRCVDIIAPVSSVS